MKYKMLERLKIKRTLKKRYRDMPIYGKRLFTDFGGIGFYKIVSIYGWKEYSECGELPGGSHWFEHSLAIIRSEYGVKYSIPWIELGMRSVYEDGKIVLK